MTTRPRHRNDAHLWAQMVSTLKGEGLDSEAAELAARRLVALVRQEQKTTQRTWAPGDPLPAPPPQRVSDLDGAVWEHQDGAGHGCYRMAQVDRARYAEDSQTWEGVRPWPHLLDSEGPLTEAK